ncbi:low molecular weight protein arginine phosphatase [Bacillus sp. FJAT-47783]|uniref:low molecular weight protein arginine phosphatase n=1 Tax=Bacillus sp. FJAT-47783 TaxID=2922712 RepID=UPI001FAE2A19|nr:low molecular weight protein arginine phosphatase [Bacillus sp. FJAT-47783]
MQQNILFVCTGNTCRSPMAESLLRQMSEGKMNVRSAGVFAMDGSEASMNTIEVLKEKGIDIEHRSSSLTKELVDWATYILTMTESHKQLVCDEFPEASYKTHTLSEFVFDRQEDVIDPFGGSLETYRLTREDLYKKIEKLVEKLMEEK